MMATVATPHPSADPRASGHRPSVLVVEDDSSLRGILVETLNSAGYGVEAAADGATAIKTMESRSDLDVVLLDIGLPVVDGWQILSAFGGRRRPAVIVISARGNERDKVRALDLGADDYLGKPFGAEELMARMRAVLRRMRPPAEAARILEHGDLVIDFAGHAVLRGGAEVRLSPTEWLLLAELARNAGTTLDPRTLLQRVWGPQYADERNYLRTFVGRLRAKLEPDPSRPEVIVTVGRHGYRFGPLVVPTEPRAASGS